MMTITDEQTRDLQKLRVAARQREWNTLQDTLKRLLAELDPLIALSVAAPRLQAFLPVFETYFPEAGWVRELMLTVISYASAPNELPVNALNQFPSPGCGNFVMAVFDAARAVQPEYTVFERYSHITNAAANAILADLQHTYFGQRIDEYDRLREAEGDEQMAAQIQYAFWLDGEVAARDTALWLEIADELEQLLQTDAR